MSDKITELKARLFDIQNGIEGLKQEGKKTLNDLKDELAKEGVKEGKEKDPQFLQE